MLASSRALLVSIVAGVVIALPAGGASLLSVETDGDVGMDSSLQLNGVNAVVSYLDFGRGDLRLATCVRDCATASAAWVRTSVESAGSVGWYSSLQLDDGRPVIAYQDKSAGPLQGRLKLATCLSECASVAPNWVITTIDDTSPDVGLFPSLQLNGGDPVVAYRDRTRGDLKLATCTSGCATATPTWMRVSVDTIGDVGRYVSMQLNDGRPVISYYDVTNGTLKLATCTGGCATSMPSWIIVVVDSIPGGDDLRFSMQLRNGNPVISYHDVPNSALKLATCIAACATSAPAWAIATVDRGPSTGLWSSLRLHASNPVVSYYTNGDLKLAMCIAACTTSTPGWTITTLDSPGDVGWYPSLHIDGANAFVSYYDSTNGDLKLAIADLTRPASASETTLIEYFHGGFGHYFVTDIAAEIAALDAGQFTGWTRTGYTFKAFRLDVDGASNVCRFFSDGFAPKSSHFYTPFAYECSVVKQDPEWVFEGQVFAIEPTDAAGSCVSGRLPLYRLYNDGATGAPNHRYTISAGIRSRMVQEGWIPEGVGVAGVIGCLPA
jgi:hypothetical protein